MMSEEWPGADEYLVRDSGQRETYSTGMVRDTEDGKTDYTFLFDGPMARRYCNHMRLGALKYGRNNWQNAATVTELQRFQRSLLRHVVQWLAGDTVEDHAAAIWFNIQAAEYVRERLDEPIGPLMDKLGAAIRGEEGIHGQY